MGAEVIDELAARGHAPNVLPAYDERLGHAHAIELAADGTTRAGSDLAAAVPRSSRVEVRRLSDPGNERSHSARGVRAGWSHRLHLSKPCRRGQVLQNCGLRHASGGAARDCLQASLTGARRQPLFRPASRALRAALGRWCVRAGRRERKWKIRHSSPGSTGYQRGTRCTSTHRSVSHPLTKDRLHVYKHLPSLSARISKTDKIPLVVPSYLSGRVHQSPAGAPGRVWIFRFGKKAEIGWVKHALGHRLSSW
jgi:hypothetical protein